ncbi:MAG: sensor histidine kinase [Bacteroidia bacterium]|nr:sensor histidine kinase [Bacteroidia bacterium]
MKSTRNLPFLANFHVKVLLTAGLFFLHNLPATLQAQTEDPLFSSAAGPSEKFSAKDTTQIWAWMEKGKSWYGQNADSARFYHEKGLLLSRKIGFKKGEARCLINLANAVYDRGEYKLVVELCEQAVLICQEINLKKELAAAYNTIANSWNYQGNHHLAVNFYEKSLRAMENVEVPPYFPITVRGNLSTLYLDLKLYQKALTNSRKCLALALAIQDTATAGTASQNIAHALKKIGNTDSAMLFFQQAWEFAKITEFQTLMVTALSNMSDYYLDKGDYKKTRELLNQSLALAEKNNDEYGKVISLHGLGRLNYWEKNFPTAEKNYLEALSIGERLGMKDYNAVLYLELSDLANIRRDQDQALIYRKRYYGIRDSVANENLIQAVQEMETRYETEKKEKQILALEQEAVIRQLELRNRSIQFYGAAGLALLLLVSGFLGYRNLRHRGRLATAAALLKGQEEERSRLARDLHDGLGGRITGVRQYVQSLAGQPAEMLATSLNRAVGELDRCTSELRHIARNMMPEALTRFGLKEALEDYCDHLQEASEAEIHFFTSGLEERLPENKEIMLFRIVQELLNNAVKYSGASEIIAQITRDGDRVHITVEDDGKGFDPQILQKSPGVGWMNIISRVQYLNGVLDWHTAPGQGLSVNIESHV